MKSASHSSRQIRPSLRATKHRVRMVQLRRLQEEDGFGPPFFFPCVLYARCGNT